MTGDGLPPSEFSTFTRPSKDDLLDSLPFDVDDSTVQMQAWPFGMLVASLTTSLQVAMALTLTRRRLQHEDRMATYFLARYPLHRQSH
jgi:hypothetical protein